MTRFEWRNTLPEGVGSYGNVVNGRAINLEGIASLETVGGRLDRCTSLILFLDYIIAFEVNWLAGSDVAGRIPARPLRRWLRVKPRTGRMVPG